MIGVKDTFFFFKLFICLLIFCHYQRHPFLDARERFQIGENFLPRQWSQKALDPDGGLGWEFGAQPLVSPPRLYLESWKEETSFDAEDAQRKAKDKRKKHSECSTADPGQGSAGPRGPVSSMAAPSAARGQRGPSFPLKAEGEPSRRFRGSLESIKGGSLMMVIRRLWGNKVGIDLHYRVWHFNRS